MNEPEVFAIMGYHMKLFPPGKGSIRKTIRVMQNVVQAHASAYHTLKAIRPEARIGLAKNITIFDPLRRWNLLHWLTTFILNHIWNGAIISAFTKGRMFGRRIPKAQGSWTTSVSTTTHMRWSVHSSPRPLRSTSPSALTRL